MKTTTLKGWKLLLIDNAKKYYHVIVEGNYVECLEAAETLTKGQRQVTPAPLWVGRGVLSYYICHEYEFTNYFKQKYSEQFIHYGIQRVPKTKPKEK